MCDKDIAKERYFDDLISIIIPVYNDRKNVVQAIKSAYEQIYVNKEIIIIDDASQDDIQNMLMEYLDNKDFTYIKLQSNQGVAAARNLGVSLAKGTYIAYLDSDDWWDKDKLYKQLQVAVKNDADIVCTGRELVYDNGILTGKIIHVENEISYDKLLLHNCISCSSVLIKRAIALKYPMHDDCYHEDFINWLEITKDNHIVYGIDEPLLKYRLSKGGKSRKKLKSIYMTFMSYKTVGISSIQAILYTMSHLLNGLKKY